MQNIKLNGAYYLNTFSREECENRPLSFCYKWGIDYNDFLNRPRLCVNAQSFTFVCRRTTYRTRSFPPDDDRVIQYVLNEGKEFYFFLDVRNIDFFSLCPNKGYNTVVMRRVASEGDPTFIFPKLEVFRNLFELPRTYCSVDLTHPAKTKTEEVAQCQRCFLAPLQGTETQILGRTLRVHNSGCNRVLNQLNRDHTSPTCLCFMLDAYTARCRRSCTRPISRLPLTSATECNFSHCRFLCCLQLLVAIQIESLSSGAAHCDSKVPEMVLSGADFVAAEECRDEGSGISDHVARQKERFLSLSLPVLEHCITEMSNIRMFIHEWANRSMRKSTSLLHKGIDIDYRSVQAKSFSHLHRRLLEKGSRGTTQKVEKTESILFKMNCLATWQRFYPVEVILDALEFTCYAKTFSCSHNKKTTVNPHRKTPRCESDGVYSLLLDSADMIVSLMELAMRSERYSKWMQIPWLIRCDVLMTYPQLSVEEQYREMERLSASYELFVSSEQSFSAGPNKENIGARPVAPIRLCSAETIRSLNEDDDNSSEFDTWWRHSTDPISLVDLLGDAIHTDSRAFFIQAPGKPAAGVPKHLPVELHFRRAREALEAHKRGGVARISWGPAAYHRVRLYYLQQWRLKKGNSAFD